MGRTLRRSGTSPSAEGPRGISGNISNTVQGLHQRPVHPWWRCQGKPETLHYARVDSVESELARFPARSGGPRHAPLCRTCCGNPGVDAKRTCCGGGPTGDLGLGGIWSLRRGILGTLRWPWISGYLGPGRAAEIPRRWPLHQDRSWPGNPGATGCRIWIRKIQHSQHTPATLGWTPFGLIGRLCGFRVTAPLQLFYLVGRILQLPPPNRLPHRRLPEPCGQLAGPCAPSSWCPGLRGISAWCSPDTGS